jgi:parvulin-like peptidyl-prolyl isomerase
MERQDLLRKIVAPRVVINDDLLQKQFAIEYGEKAEVRHIQIAAPRHWEQFRQRLEQGESFAALAESYSENKLSRPRGGLLPPFARTDPSVPEIFRRVAFELQPGQISNPIQFEGAHHVFRLERLIPADPRPFDEARESLQTSLLKRRTSEEMEALSRMLLRQCELRIHDPRLREQYRQRHAAGQIEGPLLVKQ